VRRAYLTCAVWAERKCSGNSWDWLRFIIWFHSYQLDDFYSPPEPKGAILKGSFWSPRRLFLNLTTFAVIPLVPILYGAIYRARRAQAITALGRLHHSVHLQILLFRDQRQGASEAQGEQFNFDHDTLHRLADGGEVDKWTSQERPVPSWPAA
jgi:hypothetical protein